VIVIKDIYERDLMKFFRRWRNHERKWEIKFEIWIFWVFI